MRKLRQLSVAVVLTFALSASAFAGIIGTSPDAPPLEPPSATATGIVGTGPSDGQPVAAPSNPVADVALNLLQSVLSVF
ncbi:MAG TPA: hypothetical protein VK582_17460 [Pyrinomonadaceae bacterium]|nr:hypothetical protein [Pyrinomonadaceae bacterium]